MSAAGINSRAPTCEDQQKAPGGWASCSDLAVTARTSPLMHTIQGLIVRHSEGQEIHLPNYNLTGFPRTFCTPAMRALLCQHCKPRSEWKPPGPFPEHKLLRLLKTCPRAPQQQMTLPQPSCPPGWKQEGTKVVYSDSLHLLEP